MIDRGSEKLGRLPLKQLQEHPRNPRLILSEPTITALESAFRQRKAFPKKHAILVRPIEKNMYEIISGHQRVAAARRAELSEVWAFVEVMNDEQAFRELGLANTQNELHPLELALHSLGVTLAQGKKGGGLDAWAKQLGVHPVLLRRHQKGARVFEAVRPTLDMSDVAKCLTRVEQLAAIGHPDVDQSRWTSLVRTCLDEDWTIETARARARESPLEAPPATATASTSSALESSSNSADRTAISDDSSAATPLRRSNAGAPRTSSIEESLARSGSVPAHAATPSAGSPSTLATRTLEAPPSDAAAAVAGHDLASSQDDATSSSRAQVHARSATAGRDTVASEARLPSSTAVASPQPSPRIGATAPAAVASGLPSFESIMMDVSTAPPDDSVRARVEAFHVAAQAVVAVLQHRAVPVLVQGEEPFPVPPFTAPDPEDPEFDENEIHKGWDLRKASNRTDVEHEALFWMSGIRGAVLMMSAEYDSHPVDPDGEDGAYATHLLDGFQGSHRTSATYAAFIGDQADDLLLPYWRAVEAIANALLDAGVVTASDVTRMVGECTPTEPRPRKYPLPILTMRRR